MPTSSLRPRLRSLVSLLLLTAPPFFVGCWTGSRFIAADPAPPKVIVAEAEPHSAAISTEEVRILRRLVAEQRELLRGQTLSRSRTADEMLALLPSTFPSGDWSLPERGDAEDCWFETVDGPRLHGWYFPQPESRGAIVLMHGNGGHVPVWSHLAAEMRSRLKVSVLVFDYRGYGRSEGVPTFNGLIRDGQAARDYLALREQIPPTQVILLGRSMGGAIATQVAARDGARALILERTFSTLRDVADAHFPLLLVNAIVADRLKTIDELPNYHGPILISHGRSDRTIPFAEGEALFAAANEPKRFVDLGPIGHNDEHPAEYWRALDEFLETLSKAGQE